MVNKKALTEIFGLVIIVMMLLIVILIVSVAMKVNVDNRPIYLSKSISQNYLSSFLKTKTTCDDLTFSNLIEDCAIFNTGRKQCYSIVNSNFIDSCEFVKLYANYTLSETLDKWGYIYQFQVKNKDGNSPISFGNGKVTRNRDRGFYFSNEYKVYLDIYS